MPGCSVCADVLVPTEGKVCFRCESLGRSSGKWAYKTLGNNVSRGYDNSTRGQITGFGGVTNSRELVGTVQNKTIRNNNMNGALTRTFTPTIQTYGGGVTYGSRSSGLQNRGYAGGYGYGMAANREAVGLRGSYAEQELNYSECPVCPQGHTRDGAHQLHVSEDTQVEHVNCEPIVHPVKESVVQITHPTHTKTINRKLVIDKSEIFPEEVKYVHDWPVEYNYVDQIEERHFPVTQVQHSHAHNVRESQQQMTFEQSSSEEQRHDYSGRAIDVQRTVHEPPPPPAPVCIGGYCNPGPSEHATRAYNYSTAYRNAPVTRAVPYTHRLR